MRLEGLHIAEQPGWGALDRKTFIYGEGRGGRKDNIGGQRKRLEGKALKGTRGKRKDFTSEKDAIKVRVKSIKASRGGRGKKKERHEEQRPGGDVEETKRQPIYTEAQTGNGARQRTRPPPIFARSLYSGEMANP